MTLDPRSSSRRRLLAAGLGSAATAGLGTLAGSALAQHQRRAAIMVRNGRSAAFQEAHGRSRSQ